MSQRQPGECGRRCSPAHCLPSWWRGRWRTLVPRRWRRPPRGSCVPGPAESSACARASAVRISKPRVHAGPRGAQGPQQPAHAHRPGRSRRDAPRRRSGAPTLRADASALRLPHTTASRNNLLGATRVSRRRVVLQKLQRARALWRCVRRGGNRHGTARCGRLRDANTPSGRCSRARTCWHRVACAGLPAPKDRAAPPVGGRCGRRCLARKQQHAAVHRQGTPAADREARGARARAHSRADHDRGVRCLRSRHRRGITPRHLGRRLLVGRRGRMLR